MTTSKEHREKIDKLQREYDEGCKNVSWFTRILFPDVVIPVFTMAVVIALAVWAILRSVR